MPSPRKKPAPNEITLSDIAARLDRQYELDTERFKVEQERLLHQRATARATIDVAKCAKLLLESFASQVDEEASAAEQEAAQPPKKQHANGAAATK